MLTGLIGLLGSAFGAAEAVAKIYPKFSERQKKNIENRYAYYTELLESFENSAVIFKPGSNSDELLSLSDEIRRTKIEIETLYKIYAKEISK